MTLDHEPVVEGRLIFGMTVEELEAEVSDENAITRADRIRGINNWLRYLSPVQLEEVQSVVEPMARDNMRGAQNG